MVHQQDIQAVVNALWAGGADALQIMDQRVISTSAVRMVTLRLTVACRSDSARRSSQSAQAIARSVTTPNAETPLTTSAKFAVVPFAAIFLVLLGLAVRGIAENIRFRRLAAAHARSMDSSPLSMPRDGAGTRTRH